MFGESEVVLLVEGLTRTRLRRWVASGWVLPTESGPAAAFSEIDVARVRLIQHLRRDLKVGAEAVPIVLSLLDQVYGLRQELRRLAQAVEVQPDAVKASILTVARPRPGPGAAHDNPSRPPSDGA